MKQQQKKTNHNIEEGSANAHSSWVLLPRQVDLDRKSYSLTTSIQKYVTITDIIPAVLTFIIVALEISTNVL